MLDPSAYGLDPAVVSYLQGGSGSVPLQASTLDPATIPIVGTDIVNHPPPPPPPPPPPQKITVVDPAAPIIGAIGAHIPTPPPTPPPPQKIGDEYGLPAPILASIKSGFAQPSAPTVPELSGLPQAAQQPDIAAPKPVRPDVVAPIDVPTEQQVDATNKQIAQQQAYDQSVPGLMAKSDAIKNAAIDKLDQANDIGTRATTAANDATAKVLNDTAARQKVLDAQAAAQEAQFQADRQKYQQQYDQQVNDYANYKVDTNRDVGMGGLIAIALSGIGNALDHYHGPNAAAQMIEAGIDKRIQDQWNQKNQLGKNAQATAGKIDMLRQGAMDDRQAMNLQKAALLQNQAEELQKVAAQYANPQAQANALKTSAQLMNARAAIIDGEAQRKAAAAQAQAAARQQAIENAQKEEGFATTRRGQDLDFAAKQAELNAKNSEQTKAAADKQAAELRNGGMLAPTGAVTTVKNADGTTTLKPEFDYLRQQDGTPWIIGDNAEKELQPFKVRASVEHAVDAIDSLRKLRMESGGDYTSLSEDANKKIAELQRATMALMGTFGGNASPRSAEILETLQKQLTGSGDATSKLKAVEPILDQARGDIINDLNSTYRAAGYTGKPVTYVDTAKLTPPPESEMQKRVQNAIAYQQPDFDPSDDQARLTGQPSAGTIDSAEEPIRGTVDLLVQQMSDPSGTPSSRTAAMNYLGQIIKNAANSDIRDYATHSLIAAKAQAR